MKKLFFIALLATHLSAFGAQDIYPFDSPIKQQRFRNLTHNLRCLVCQNQNITESNADLARDLRHEVYVKIQEEESDQQILQYLTARYGDFILYKTPVKTYTLALWITPALFLCFSILILFFNVHRTSRKT